MAELSAASSEHIGVRKYSWGIPHSLCSSRTTYASKRRMHVILSGSVRVHALHITPCENNGSKFRHEFEACMVDELAHFQGPHLCIPFCSLVFLGASSLGASSRNSVCICSAKSALNCYIHVCSHLG